MKTVLFLCTGNYYRSRFAELVFNRLAEADGLAWRAESRGMWLGYPGNVGPISPHAIRGLEARGLHLPEPTRFPMLVTTADLERADLVVAVKESEHRPMIAATFADWVDRIEYWHIDDLDCAGPDEALLALEQEVRRLAVRLALPSIHRPAPESEVHEAARTVADPLVARSLPRPLDRSA